MKDRIKGFSITYDEKTIMSADINGVLHFNPTYYKDMNYGDFIKQYGSIGIGQHEAGHIIESYILDAKFPNYKDIRDEVWNNGIISQNIVNSAIKTLKKNASFKDLSELDLRLSISDYALESYSETFAEAVRDYTSNGDDASPLSVEIFKIIERYLG